MKVLDTDDILNAILDYEVVFDTKLNCNYFGLALHINRYLKNLDKKELKK